MLIGQFKFQTRREGCTQATLYPQGYSCIASHAEAQSLQEFWVGSEVGIIYIKYCNVNPGQSYTPSSQ